MALALEMVGFTEVPADSQILVPRNGSPSPPPPRPSRDRPRGRRLREEGLEVVARGGVLEP